MKKSIFSFLMTAVMMVGCQINEINNEAVSSDNVFTAESSGLTAFSWNIIEDCVPFVVKPCSNGENTMTIEGETYLVFGERTKYPIVAGEKDLFYKIK